MAERVLCLDAGNAWIKGVTDNHSEVRFPHALHEISAEKVDAIQMRGGTDDPNIYSVNGVYYAIGEQAMREGDGSVKYGEARYERGYYGVIAAIAMFKAFEESARNLFVYGSHTPKDLDYRPDLVTAVKGSWVVEGQGTKKTFRVTDAQGADEPVMAFRHAVLSDDGTSYRGDVQLRKGDTLIIDIGGFTTAMTTAIQGKIDYLSAVSHDGGIIDARERLATSIRRRYRTKLKGVNFLKTMELENALRTGKYNAGMEGELDCVAEVDAAVNPLLTTIMNHINNYGGLASFDAILLAGGGGALMEKRLRHAINKQHIYVSEQDRSRIQYSTSYGMLKTLRALEAKGKRLA